MTSCLGDLFRHNRWANLQMIDCCAKLTDVQLDATVPGTYGTIRATLIHIFDSERYYVAFLQSPERPTFDFWEDDFPGFDTMRREADRTGTQLIELSESATENDVLHRTKYGGPYTISRGLLFAQVINHATDHRSQLATMLTQRGVEPPDLDGWMFNETAGQG